jgi:hypothetical protein
MMIIARKRRAGETEDREMGVCFTPPDPGTIPATLSKIVVGSNLARLSIETNQNIVG